MKTLSVLVSSLLLFSGSLRAETKPISLSDLPPNVKKAVETQLAGGKVSAIEKDDSGQATAYTVHFRKPSGQEREFAVAENGDLLSTQISLEETPAEVQKRIKAQVADGTVGIIEKSFEEDVSYEVEFTKKDGTEGFVSVAPDGRVTSLQMSLQEIPAAVRKTIESQVGAGKLGTVLRLIEGTETFYSAELARDGKTRELIVAPSGQLESTQVFLSEIPTEAQQTIRERLGNGRIVRIEKSSEKRQGVQPFDVVGRKDGKAFNFSVGPKGRFLGMN